MSEADLYKSQHYAALMALDALVKTIEQIGGYLTPEHQGRVLDALFLLETNGIRPLSRSWRVKP